MRTLLLVGLGGAVGSVLRAWLGTLVVALTGPEFPWGTILINVVGSFVIGFFATLTAPDGRFASALDLRALVMVGLCGGFTTFSSFSLQTLELLRDGRAAQAAANIALSVLLCLGSVAAGSRAGLEIRVAAPVRTGALAPDAFARRTLVVLHRPAAVGSMLATATRLVGVDHDGIVALAVDGPALVDLLPTAEIMTRERRAREAEARADWVGAMRPTLDGWAATEREAGRRARWIEVRGDGARAIVEHGRGTHLVLLEHLAGDAAAAARIRAVLVRAARPLLLVPPDVRPAIGRVVAVAWRDDAPAALAMRAAMPLLAAAERVVVIEAGPGRAGALPVALRDLPVERRRLEGGADDQGDHAAAGRRLLALADAEGADLLVMESAVGRRHGGAIFDGVTETVLREARLAVLMQPAA